MGKLTGRAKRQAQTVEGKRQAAFEAASQQAESLNSKNTATAGGETRYALNEKFSQQFDRWINDKDEQGRLKTGGYFNVGTTSEALKSIGVKDYNIYWDKSKIAKIMGKHSGMTAEVIKEVPQILEHPILVMQSQTVANRITIYGETVDADGTPVLVAMELKPQDKKGEILDFAKIASAYGKKTIQNAINTSEILYVDSNKKRIDTWLDALRLQLPAGLTKYGSIGTVTYVDRDVNGNLSFGDGSGKTAMQEAFSKAEERTRYSLKDYSDAEQRDHRKKAIAFFGKTYNWNETGYLTPAGTKPHVSELAQFLSLKGTENAQEIAALKRENESLKERVEYWKGQTRRPQGVTTDRESVQKAADALVKDYGAEISGSDIAGDLQSLYDFNPRICQW